MVLTNNKCLSFKTTINQMNKLSKNIKKSSSKKHSKINIDNLTNLFSKINIEHNQLLLLPSSYTLQETLVAKIKENDIVYFIQLLNSYIGKTLALDSDAFFVIGKYASLSLCNILKNCGLLDEYFNNSAYMDKLIEGIADSDNSQLINYTMFVNCDCEIKIKEYLLCFNEKKAYKCMETALKIISTFGNTYTKQICLFHVNTMLNRVIDTFDSTMIGIFIRTIKVIKNDTNLNNVDKMDVSC